LEAIVRRFIVGAGVKWSLASVSGITGFHVGMPARPM
jgi:hypothetical protein